MQAVGTSRSDHIPDFQEFESRDTWQVHHAMYSSEMWDNVVILGAVV
jgi:hypothetical protein